MAEVLSFDDKNVLALVEQNSGKAIPKTEARKNDSESVRKLLLANLRDDVEILHRVRRGAHHNIATGQIDNCRDITLGQFMQERYGFEWSDRTGLPTEYLRQLGANPSDTSIEQLTGSLGGVNSEYRFLIPEILLESARLGLRRKPYYKSLIRREMSVSQQYVSIPQVNESNIEFTKVNEGETIPTGSISYNQRQVRAHKYAAGIRLTDEVMRMTKMDVLADALESAGALQGFGMDRIAIRTLLNGDDIDPEAVSEIGVQTANKLAARDLNRTWLRLTRMGLTPTCIIAGDEMALDLMEIPDFNPFNSLTNGKSRTTLNLAGLPEKQDILPHGGISTDKLMVVCAGDALIKLNVLALNMTEERSNSNGTITYYMSETCGFVIWKKTARVVINRTKAFVTNGFSSRFDLSKYEDMTK